MHDQERIVVAHHEAGHVLAAWAVHGVEIKEVRLHDEGGTTYLDRAAPNPLGELLISAAAGEVDNITRGEGWCFDPGNRHDIFDINDAVRSMGIDPDEMGPRYMAVMERADRVCRKFVRKNFPWIHEVALALAERGVLTGDELASMLPAELRDSLYRPKPRRTSKRQTELFP